RIAFRTDRISRHCLLRIRKAQRVFSSALLFFPPNSKLSVRRWAFDVCFLLTLAQRLSFCEVIRNNLRSRWRARRFRNLVAPDRREITRRVRHHISWRTSPERGRGELSDRRRVSQESV